MVAITIENRSRSQYKDFYGTGGQLLTNNQKTLFGSLFFLNIIDETRRFEEDFTDEINAELNIFMKELPMLVDRLEEMVLEAMASQALLNFFGLPLSKMAVHVFEQLSSNAIEDNSILLREITKIALTLVKGMELIKYKIKQKILKEIEFAETEEEESATAAIEVQGIETGRHGDIGTRVKGSIIVFDSRADRAKKEADNMGMLSGIWDKIIEGLEEKYENLGLLQLMNKGVALDPSLAIPVVTS